MVLFELFILFIVCYVLYRLAYAVYLALLPVGHPRRVAHVQRQRKILGRSNGK